MTIKIELPHKVLLRYDSEADAAYLRLRPGKVARSREEAPGLVADLDAKGALLGLEILDASRAPRGRSLHLARLSARFRAPVLKHLRPQALARLYVG